VSRDSIRNKIDEAKRKSHAALSSGKASPDIMIAVESLLLVIEILSTVFLEKKTRKNSSNSGLPPSKNEGSNGNCNQGSGDRADVGSSASNTRLVKTSETVTPLECSICGENLEDVKVKRTDERKKIDVIFEIISHTVISESKECPECQHLNKCLLHLTL
jgi:hypothetical protein